MKSTSRRFTHTSLYMPPTTRGNPVFAKTPRQYKALGRRVAYLQLEILIRSLVRKMFRILGRPFEAIRAKYSVSRRVE